MLGYNRPITCANIYVLLNIGPGVGRGKKEKKGYKVTVLPTLLTMIVARSGPGQEKNDIYTVLSQWTGLNSSFLEP